ncbi:MAG TPA: PAS domain-containing sensor histidine kinase [Polyangiaceae bacterium]|jgi:PAS domain S-box-containing protein|nr:PAS domain-containing sensor histidine kinase [Polyangiaceae bacterium]
MTLVLSAAECRTLVEHSPVMIWRSGLDAKCDYFNDRWLAFTGRSIGQEIGDGWAEGVHPDDRDRSVADYLSHFRRREPFELEYRLRRSDGVYRWISDRGVPFTHEAGTFSGFIGSCIDVDDRRRAQAERERQDQEQIALARQFSQWVLSIVSHDIRNPLAAIDGSARALALRANDELPLRKIAERISRNVDRIMHIVRDLLDFSRDRYGRGIPVVLAPANMHGICRDVVDEVVSSATDRSIIVECTGDASGTWDGHRMAQAVSNLLGNAVQHSPAGTPVHVLVRGERDQVVVEVHNEGAIPGDRMTTLFEAFGSSTQPAAHHEGLGLGLFIARAIARVHHGNIEVASAPESGTTFRVALPREGGFATTSSLPRE